MSLMKLLVLKLGLEHWAKILCEYSPSFDQALILKFWPITVLAWFPLMHQCCLQDAPVL